MPIRAVFLDAGGVLLDTTIMAPQWQRLLGDFLAPRLGGDPAAWGPANVYAAERMWARYRDPGGTPRETHGRLRRLWLREMCERVGIVPPREASAIADEAYAWVSERVTAPMPGVVELARALSGRGVRLFTSTGQPSIEIGGYLRALGIRELFERTYGTDLVDRWKTSAGYYRRILEDAGVPASEAATVDDHERALGWARRAGMRTFLYAPKGALSEHELVTSLGDVVERIEREPV